MQGYVLIKTQIGDIHPALNILRRTGGIVSAHATFGPHDIIALAEAEGINELRDLVTRQIAGISEVADTTTLIVMDG